MSDDTLELTIEDIAYGGDGVGRVDGLAVFVPHTAVGDRVHVAVTSRRPRFARAELVTLLEAADTRVACACPLAGVCPGCAYQHLAYAEETRAKQAQLGALLRRIGRIAEPPLADPTPSPHALGYRNKLVLHRGPADDSALGYVVRPGGDVLPIPACPLAVDAINERLSALLDAGELPGAMPPDADLTLRYTVADGVAHWSTPPGPGLAAPDRRLLEKCARMGLLVPPESFFQVNTDVAGRLVDAVADRLVARGARTVVDLYCGVGLFALAAGRAGVAHVLGVDADRPAIGAAHHNARRMRLAGVEFTAGPARRVLSRALRPLNPAESAVVLDPPRSGLAPAVLRCIAESGPATVLYVSCAPDRLARDIAALGRAGYRLAQAQVFDMFPRTAHFEVLAELHRS